MSCNKIRKWMSVPLSGISAVRVRCKKCQAVFELPTVPPNVLTDDTGRAAWNTKYFKQATLKCKVCELQLSDPVANSGQGDNPLHDFYKALSNLNTHKDAVEIELILPVESEGDGE
jgi:hypothetical protein